MPRDKAERQRAGQRGGLNSWANTADRTQRTAGPRRRSPGQLEWHLERLDPVQYKNASDEQRTEAAITARTEYFRAIVLKRWHPEIAMERQPTVKETNS